jgi:hypothetical protein
MGFVERMTKPFLIHTSILILCVACGPADKRESSLGDEGANGKMAGQTLPNGRLTIVGEAATGDNTGSLDCVYGGHDGTLPGEQEIGLMYLLVIAPDGAGMFRKTDKEPNHPSFQWDLTNNQTAAVSVLYDPEAHDIRILDKVYRLNQGNYFLINVQSRTQVHVQQLPEPDFGRVSREQALRTFKRRCKDSKRVQDLKGW